MSYYGKYKYEDFDICCSSCDEKREHFKKLTEWFEEVINHLYFADLLEMDHLENCLDEMAHLLRTNLPAKELDIQKVERMPFIKTSNVKPLDILNVDEWREWNNQYLKTINS